MALFKLDIIEEHCPMTFVKVQIQLNKMVEGDILNVYLSKGEPLDNVPKAARDQGHKILEILEVKDPIYKVVIEK
jgi:TusA-related sulfurtransferase